MDHVLGRRVGAWLRESEDKSCARVSLARIGDRCSLGQSFCDRSLCPEFFVDRMGDGSLVVCGQLKGNIDRDGRATQRRQIYGGVEAVAKRLQVSSRWDDPIKGSTWRRCGFRL